MASNDEDTNVFNKLLSSEIIWREHYSWLKERGYQLRARYAPDWTPSWKKTGKSALRSEDGHPLMYAQVNDAIQIATGRHVAIKLVYKEEHPTEREVMDYLSSEAFLKDKRNHCIPLLEVLRPLGDDNIKLEMFVMPYARPIETPPFDTVGEVVQCVRELLEGLQLLHEHHIAHRDFNANNVMMEPEKIFPRGHHPVSVDDRLDLSGSAPFYTRTQRPSKYYIIDFGISSRYSPEDTAPLEPIIIGGDKTVPEFQNTTAPHNPFWTDIYYAGNLINEHFLQGCPGDAVYPGYRGAEFLQPLVNDMTQVDPSKRPTIHEVVTRFNQMVENLSTWKLRSRVRLRGASAVHDVSHFISHWGRKLVFVMKGTPAIPRPQT